MGSSKKRIRYAYDAAGNRRLMVDPDGGRFTYAYDALNRISHLVNPQGERTTYAYDADGRRTVKKLANGTRASFTYDDGNNLTRLANLKSDGTTISSFGYKYDRTGNRTSVVEADGSRVTWSYDATYQLTGEHRTGTTPYRNTFAYDPRGNRTLKNEDGARTTYAYDAANQLKYAEDASGRTTYTFDADGNQQLVEEPTGDRTTTVWDYENRTTLVALPSGIRNTMAYEPDGLRVKLEESTGTKKFVWDEQNYLAEADENDDVEVVYTNEPRLYGHLISQRRSGVTNCFHFDAVGSTRQLTSAAAAVSDTYLYDAWGVLLSSSGSTANPFRFVGQSAYYSDTEMSSAYVRTRIYAPLIARWTSMDPVLTVLYGHLPNTFALDERVLSPYAEVWNLFSYVNSNPASLIDPSGWIPEHCMPPCPSWCGPDIGSQLKATLLLAVSEFYTTNWFLRQWWCSNPGTWLSWDFYPDCWDRSGSEGKCGTCCFGPSGDKSCCVSVFGFKHNQWNVNYALWGAMMGLCHHSLAFAISFAHLHKHKKWLFGQSECGHEATDTLDAWISAGYRVVGGHTTSTSEARMMPLTMVMPQYNDPRFDSCAECPDGYSTTATPCHFRWFDNNDVTP